ncbi:MAG: hypothetical protein ACQKBW_01090 [Puniceicoccales bacterium]
MNEPVKTVPISGRISQQDYDFMMQHSFGGKVTASEKLRHVASFFRQYHEHFGTYAEGVEELNRLTEPARKNLKKLEYEQNVHSELVDIVTNILPLGLAHLASRQQEPPQKEQLPYLLETEERLLTLVLRLVEQVLRLGLTSESPTYNPHLLEDKLQTISELVGLLSKRKQN